MGWTPEVRRIIEAGRRPYYRLTINRQQHHLGTDRAAAYRQAAKILAGHPVTSAPETVPGLIRAWQRETGNPLYWVGRFGDWGADKDLVEMEPADLQRYADWLKTQKHQRAGTLLMPWTIRHYVAAARAVWIWGYGRGWVSCKPDPKTKTTPPVLHPRHLEIDAIKAALDALNPRARAIAGFIGTTGCRPSEARSVLWSEIDFKASMAIKEKHKTTRTGNIRTFPIPRPAMQLVTQQPKINSHVFNTIRGTPWTKDGLHTVLERVGLNNVYALRHTFAQWYLDHGGPKGTPGDRSELQEILGHSDGRMLDVYARVRSDRLKRIAKRIRGPILP